MNEQDVLEQVKRIVIERFSSDTSGHDHFHIERVVNLSKHIAKKEGAHLWTCEMIAWLHEMDDYKLSNGNGNCERLLKELGVSEGLRAMITDSCEEISFKGNEVDASARSLETKVVQDADRLDAIGAIGVARTFAYGGKKGQAIYHPDIEPKKHKSFEEYKKADTTTINHFYEKLLLLKDLMNTNEGKRIAEERHDFLRSYLDRFLREWSSVDI